MSKFPFSYRESLIGIRPPESIMRDFPGGSVVKNPPANAGDAGSIPGLGRSPGEGKGYPLHYSGQKNSMDYRPWGHKDLDTTDQFSLSLHFQI